MGSDQILPPGRHHVRHFGDQQARGERRRNDTLHTAASRMADVGVGSLPICGSDNRLKGMLTDRDIVVKAVAAGRDPGTVTAAELAQGKPVTIGADDDAA